MLVIDQKSCFLEPSIFEIPQPNWYDIDHRFSTGLLHPGVFNPARFNPNYRSFNSLQLNPANNFLSYEGPAHENQGKRSEVKNENLLGKTNEVQSVIHEEDNTSEKTSNSIFFIMYANSEARASSCKAAIDVGRKKYQSKQLK